jgi:hypothetical protein
MQEYLVNSSARGQSRRNSGIEERRLAKNMDEGIPEEEGPSLVDEHYRVLKPGLTNEATWDR